MTIPPDHLVHLKKQPFIFGCSMMVFPPDEFKALMEFGNWMEALVDGLIQPITVAQEHFLKVNREEENPKTVYERAWLRWKGRREYERQQRITPPSPKAENYGIVEWDADRWW